MMRSIKSIIGFCLLLSASPVNAGSPEMTFRLKPILPDSVTVFEDRARVHRRLEMDVVPGTREVVFVALPGSLDPSSVRARLSGVSGMVLGVRLERELHVEDTQEEVRLLVKQIHQLEDQLSNNNFRLEELNRRKQITVRLAKILEDSISKSGGDLFGGVTSSQVITAQQWIADRLLELALEKDRLLLQRVEIEKKHQDLSSDLEPLQRQQGRTSWLATVLVQAQEEGRAIVELAHDVSGASWIPIHEARLDEASGQVEWRSKAQVVQKTGEDWKDVLLTLSTARSSLGLAAPSLVPMRVDAIVGLKPADISVDETDAASAKSERGESRARGRDQQAEQIADLAGAIVSSGSGPARFEIRAPATIPADGSNHAVLISEQTMAAELDYQSIPLISPHVFRRAVLLNSGQAPLLAGIVRCFRDGSYVGNGSVQRIASGQQFSQHFGSDGRIVVQKEEIEDRTSEVGSFSDDLKLVKAYRIRVRSLISGSVPFELVDRIPVSLVEGVEVKLSRETSPEPSVDEDGIVRWNGSLVQDQESVFVLQWMATAEKEHAKILERIR
ncbi:MAG: mucoidy inhibitor MuiA family protein [Planctomycetota bacterium]|nr:mucoidy inhibitor MuiA family protein [Planctomycetota bacterium]